MKYLDLSPDQMDRVHILSNSNKKYMKVNEFTNENGDVIVLMADKKDSGVIRFIWVSLETFLNKNEDEVLKV